MDAVEGLPAAQRWRRTADLARGDAPDDAKPNGAPPTPGRRPNGPRQPTVLDSILTNGEANARHRIESAKELRVIATPENQNSPLQSDSRFIIQINLGADTEIYNKPLAIGTDDPGTPKLAAPPKLIIDNDEKRDE